MPHPGKDFGTHTEAQPDPLGYAATRLRHRPELHWSDAHGSHVRAIEARCVAGSADGADFVLRDPSVSRLHAELDPRDDGLWVRDLDSTNGTFVEGVMVTAARVPDGAQIQLGATRFVVRYGATPAPVELWSAPQFGPLIGRSAAMRELFARLARIAPTDSTVLIQGETGTGKELVARALHEASARAGQPLVVVDCAALPEHLLEAELFGYRRGAFTGATEAHAGAIESAEGGTVFLDEVGELPLAMQPKLLRAIEARAVRRLGETAYRDVKVRFVSATHRDLRTMVNTGGFREDLYFRLAVVPITIPPLRARRDDLPALVEHFLPPSSRAAIGPDLMRELAARPWYGNVRELRNFVERALALGAREALAMTGASTAAVPAPGAAATAGLPPELLDASFKDARERWVDRFEREYIHALLERYRHNVTAVANAAGLDRSYVHRLIRRHEL